MNHLSQRISIVESELAELQSKATNLSRTVSDLRKKVSFEEETSDPTPAPPLPTLAKSSPPPLSKQDSILTPPPEIRTKEKAVSLPSRKEVAGIEMQLGKVWSVRLGILLLTTGFVFLSRYTYENIVRDLGPGVRLIMMYLLSFALTGAGLFCEGWKDSLKSYGRIVAAGGLAAIYYCGFAAHNVEALRVIESPVLASIILTASAGLFCAVSLWRESRVMLSTSLALAFYSISVNPIGWMACLSAVILATLGIIMMVRYRWVEVGFVVLLGCYLSFIWWQFAVAQGAGDLEISRWFLLAYWILFAAASIVARRDMTQDRHALFSSFNNSAFFLLFSFHLETGQWMSGHWIFCLIFGSILIGLGLATKSHFPEKSRFIHLAKGLGIFTLGLALLLNGHHLFIALLIEALVLMALNLKNPHLLTKAASWTVGILSCLALAHSPLSETPALAVLFGTFGWLAFGTLHRFVDRVQDHSKPHQGGVIAAVIALAFLVFGFMSDWSHPDRVLMLGALGVIATFLGLSLKIRAYVLDLLLVFHATALIALVSLFPLAEHSIATLLISSFFALTISAPLVILCRKAATQEKAYPLHLLSGAFLAISLALLALSLETSALPEALKLVIILLIPIAGTMVSRVTGLLAHSLVPFAMLLAALHLDLFDGPLLMIGVVLSLSHLALVTKHHQLIDRDFLRHTLLVIAAAFWGFWLIEVLSNPAIPLTLTAVGLLLTSRHFHQTFSNALSVPFFIIGFALAFLQNQTGELYLCLIAPLSLHLLRSKEEAPMRYQALAIISLILLWAQLTRDACPLPIAAVWAVTGTILLLTGLALKSRCFRLLALMILIASLGHLMLIDLVKLDPLPRILSFMTLGLGLLGLGFVYNRYQDRLKQIL